MGNYVIGVGNYVSVSPSDLGNYLHDTHVIPMGNYVSEVGNYVSASRSNRGIT